MKVLSIHHPLFLANELKRGLLEALLCQVSETTVGHLAQAIGVSASVVCTHVPFHLLERAREPLCDWGLVNGPVVFLCIFPQSKPITVATATVPKLSTAVPLTTLEKKEYLLNIVLENRLLPEAIHPECRKDSQLELFQAHSMDTSSSFRGRVLPGQDTWKYG